MSSTLFLSTCPGLSKLDLHMHFRSAQRAEVFALGNCCFPASRFLTAGRSENLPLAKLERVEDLRNRGQSSWGCKEDRDCLLE